MIFRIMRFLLNKYQQRHNGLFGIPSSVGSSKISLRNSLIPERVVADIDTGTWLESIGVIGEGWGVGDLDLGLSRFAFSSSRSARSLSIRNRSAFTSVSNLN